MNTDHSRIEKLQSFNTKEQLSKEEFLNLFALADAMANDKNLPHEEQLGRFSTILLELEDSLKEVNGVASLPKAGVDCEGTRFVGRMIDGSMVVNYLYNGDNCWRMKR